VAALHSEPWRDRIGRVLSVVCTAIAFLLFFRLIAEIGPCAPP